MNEKFAFRIQTNIPQMQAQIQVSKIMDTCEKHTSAPAYLYLTGMPVTD